MSLTYTLDRPNPDLELLGRNPEKRFLNRELSWLAFNERVLEEADNKSHPIFERVKFLSISASNLDEFHMVRVAGLKAQVAAGVKSPTKDSMTPRQQLIAIHERVRRLTNHQQEIWNNLTNELGDNRLSILEIDELEKNEIDWLDNYFMEDIFPVLTPLAVDPVHPFPFIPNFGLTLALELSRRSDNRNLNGLLPLPGQIKRFINLPGGNGRFIILEKVIILNIAKLFPGFSIKEVGAFRIIRDSDIEILEEAEDLVRVFETALKRRRRGNIIRLTIESSMQDDLRTFVTNNIGVNKEDTSILGGILGLDRISELINESRPDLMFKSFDIR
ncbi:MAG: RNA degradosome polyphosphate kinase, partial [Alphaproteobacteria bacterium]|nr:RNA degradosome polyphosphate kinase [Alphaproteobacteria bacterium]